MQRINLKESWENSYNNKDNFVFFPHEEVIRFAAKYVVKRVGLNEFNYITKVPAQFKVLDLGCGIGRHVMFFEKMNVEAYGIDLSEKAIEMARKWARQENIIDSQLKLLQGDIIKLPWDNEYFDCLVSHGVLDSMPFEVAQKAILEAHRVLGNDGVFYCDLVSGDSSMHFREFSGEEIVETEHEKDTIQSYFNYSKLKELIGAYFDIEECKLIKHENVLSNGYHSRYHVVLRKRKEEKL